MSTWHIRENSQHTNGNDEKRTNLEHIECGWFVNPERERERKNVVSSGRFNIPRKRRKERESGLLGSGSKHGRIRQNVFDLHEMDTTCQYLYTISAFELPAYWSINRKSSSCFIVQNSWLHLVCFGGIRVECYSIILLATICLQKKGLFKDGRERERDIVCHFISE